MTAMSKPYLVRASLLAGFSIFMGLVLSLVIYKSTANVKSNAIELVKIGSSIIGGAGGGGRSDFAQAGGKEVTKITESFNKIIKLIK